MNIIASRNNDKIKSIVKLHDKKARNEEKKFFFEGIKLTEEYINKIGIPCEIYIREDIIDKYNIIKMIPEEKITCVSASVYDKISDEKSPQGILCVAEYLNNINDYKDITDGGIILESIRDAGNLGTIIRTAAALGIKTIYLSDNCADIYNTKTIRANMGAVFSANISVCDNIKKHVSNKKAAGNKVYAAMPRGDAAVLGQCKITNNDAVVVGNEGEGISDETAELCDALTIPMEKNSESLNAATAAAIIMWEMRGN